MTAQVGKKIAETSNDDTGFKKEDEVAQQIKKHFEDMTGESVEDCVLTKNFSKWARVAKVFGSKMW